jgi:hypothetical protein
VVGHLKEQKPTLQYSITPSPSCSAKAQTVSSLYVFSDILFALVRRSENDEEITTHLF